jgi:hypothetical protein
VGAQAMQAGEQSSEGGFGSPQTDGQPGGGTHCVGLEEGDADGDSDGGVVGTGVGLQSPSSGASRHIVGQQVGHRSNGKGMTSQSGLLKSVQRGKRSNGSTSQQRSGHSAVRTLHGVGTGDGAGEGRGVGVHPIVGSKHSGGHEPRGGLG